mmetsp:Transcript_3995/g.10094  ORF Transcript_3995/g.10094 Transcript_3995/m.10094 type:complete len:381 (-) Transcript_3995:62-1204(-)
MRGHPLSAGIHGAQRHVHADLRGADGDGVLHFVHLRTHVAFRGVGEVAHAPAHHAVRLREGEDVDDVRPADAGMLQPIVHKVLVCVVHHQPDASPLADVGRPLYLLTRHQHAGWIVRVDNGHHPWGTFAVDLRLQPVEVGVEGVGAAGPKHHAAGAAGHLVRHEVVEVVRREQHAAVRLVGEREHHVGIRLVGPRRHHHLHPLQRVLLPQLAAQRLPQLGQPLRRPVLVDLAALQRLGGGRHGRFRRRPVHDALRQRHDVLRAGHERLGLGDDGRVGAQHTLRHPRRLICRRCRHGYSYCATSGAQDGTRFLRRETVAMRNPTSSRRRCLTPPGDAQRRPGDCRSKNRLHRARRSSIADAALRRADYQGSRAAGSLTRPR